MNITLGSTYLVEGQTRNSTGSPVGPADLRIAESPGAAVREFVGADRVQPEHIRCDSGVVSFGVTRTYGSVADALAYLSGSFLSEASEGQLKFDSTNVFGPKSVVTQRVAALVGRTVHVDYTIQG